jgi:ATP-dependent exoDNAse (exonuclease V) beta subunit
VDLVHRVDDHWSVIDYKTDLGGVASTTKYDAQLKAYREMWEKMTGGDVRSELISTRAKPGP